jgi:gluconolactonase
MEQSPRQYIRAFDVGPDGATLTGGDIFHKIAPGYCDGMRVDEYGNIHCISPDGELPGRIFVPHTVDNVTFGSPAKNCLFIGGSTTLYAIFLNCRGVQVP